MTRTSPLDGLHRANGARMGEFGGWMLPMVHGGTVAEHLACRSAAAVFDVSHLGTVEVSGPEALDALQRAFTNDLAKVAPGRAQYTHLLGDDASVTDDIIVWWLEPERFHVMPNASNTDGVRAAVGGDDITATRALVAVQGPTARQVVAAVSPEMAGVGRFRVGEVSWGGTTVVVAGTGYTGEDGVEIAVPVDAAEALWQAVVEAGAVPAGLAARDTLRLEAGLPLHGHDLGPGITPLQAGLGWVVAWDKGPFSGRDALLAERDAGPVRRMVGVVGAGRRPLRDGADVIVGDRVVGVLTSGGFSPVLERGIGLALIEASAGVGDGAAVEVVVGAKRHPATVIRPPFVELPSAPA